MGPMQLVKGWVVQWDRKKRVWCEQRRHDERAWEKERERERERDTERGTRRGVGERGSCWRMQSNLAHCKKEIRSAIAWKLQHTEQLTVSVILVHWAQCIPCFLLSKHDSLTILLTDLDGQRLCHGDWC